jgi:hypothetical protein
MKTKGASLLIVILLTTTQCMTQNRFTVSAQNNDISNNLDLKAVATAFGESKDLQDFEQRLNDYDSGISNLDLNNDGQVDYLRVIENNENNVHVVVIQAVLDRDVFQDVATIVVDKDYNSNTTVQIIGDPYLYGDNYIIEPSYYYTPSIFSWFWGSNYYRWNSPYYWGYYPNYYHHRHSCDLDVYLSNVYSHVNHNQRYYYTNSIRNDRAMRLQNSIHRNDFGNRHPDKNFSNRNENIRNKRDLEFNRNGVVRGNQNRQGNQGNSPRNYDNSNGSRNSQTNGYNQRNSNQRTYSTPYDSRSSNSGVNPYQTRTNTNESVNRSNNTWQNSGVNRNQSNSNNQTYTSPSNNRGNNGLQRNNTYQPSNSNSDNGNRNNSVDRNNQNTVRTPVAQPAQVQQRTTTTSQPVSRGESRQENRDNSKRSDDRR